MRDRLHVSELIKAARKVWDEPLSMAESFEEFLIDVSYFAYQGVVRMSINSFPDDVEGDTFQRDWFIYSWTDTKRGCEPYLSWGMERRHALALWEYRRLVGRDNLLRDKAS